MSFTKFAALVIILVHPCVAHLRGAANTSVLDENATDACAGNASRRKIIMIQDACLDDFLSLTVMARAHKAGEVELLGDIVVNGDSVVPQSMEVNYKFHQKLGIGDVPLLLSRARLFNPFPWLYRGDTWTLANTKAIQSIEVNMPWKQYEDFPDADAWLVKTLQEACPNSITILHLTAQTNLQNVFQINPSLQTKIKEMVWMAGAVDVPGNTDGTGAHGPGHGYPGMNSYAEWNVYADAFAAKYVMENTDFPIRLVPLDLCNKLPLCNNVSCEFMETMEAQDVTQCMYPEIHTALKQAFKKSVAASPFLRLWDSAALMYTLKPDLFLDEGTKELAVVTGWHHHGRLAQPLHQEFEKEQRYRNVSVLYNLTGTSALHEVYQFLASAACKR